MDFLTALKSGKPMRRSSWDDCYGEGWITLEEYKWIDDNYQEVSLQADAYLADDWEIKEESITVTSTQLYSAWDKALDQDMKKNWGSDKLWLSSKFFEILLEELGFKNET